MNKLERLKKYANGGKVAKFKNPAGPIIPGIENITNLALEAIQAKLILALEKNNTEALAMAPNSGGTLQPSQKYLTQTQIKPDPSELTFNSLTGKIEGLNLKEEEVNPENVFKTETISEDTDPNNIKGNTKLYLNSEVASAIGGAAVAAINAVDGATMGDKNFSASSLAIDTGVHMASGALIKSGNPFAIGAGVALEGLNWLTKAGGQNVLGYDVNIKNSGYSTDMTHLESEAGRIWDKWSGATARKLAKRNEKARMALAAMDISNDVSFEQEARANSVDDILRQNTIALNGGIDTSLLGS